METRTSQEITINFNKTVNNLVTRLEKRSNTLHERADLDRLRQRINLLRKMNANGGQVLLEHIGPILLSYSEEILSRNEEFFMTMDLRDRYALNTDNTFIFSMMDNIKNMYNKAKQKEKDDVYKEVLSLHTDYIGYCMITNCDPFHPTT